MILSTALRGKCRQYYLLKVFIEFDYRGGFKHLLFTDDELSMFDVIKVALDK